MRLLSYVTLLFMLVLSLKAKSSYVFVPLPMKNKEKTMEEFLPLVNYINRTTLPLTYTYKKDYEDILRGFKEQNIDIAYLGPLPYALLVKEYPYVRPIITLKPAKKKKNGYRCVLAKFTEDTLPKNRPLKVALTQPDSTCGYFMTSKLLQKSYGLLLLEQNYTYTMSHSNALLEVLKGNYDIAGASDTIAQKFESLGMQIIASSEKLPSFAIVVNTKTISQEDVKKLQKSILSVPQEQYENWGTLLKYGFDVAPSNLFSDMQIDEVIPQKGNYR